jgi:hypothetical protein
MKDTTMTSNEKTPTEDLMNVETLTEVIQVPSKPEVSSFVDTIPYYRYCPTTFVALDVVRVALTDTPPPNSTPWAPPTCGVATEAYFDGVGWSRCPAYRTITPELLRATLTDIAKRELRESLAVIKANVADEEVDTYQQQYADAKEFIASGQASTFLKVLSSTRDKPIEALARTIVRKADAYHTSMAKALAAYQNTVDVIATTEPILTQALLRERRMLRV